MFVAEAPGEQEHATGKPFCSNAPAGKTFNQLLNQAGIIRQECLIANVAREKPPGNKISFFYEDLKCTIPKPIMQGYINYLKEEILKYKPHIIIALGNTALYTLTGLKSIQETRGYIFQSTLVPGVKVLPTYHPQAINYDWKLHWQTIIDLQKGLKNSLTPELPKEKRNLQAGVSKSEYIEYLQFLLNDHKEPIAVDIETASPGSHIDIMGIADSPTHAVSFDFLQNRKPRYSIESELEIWQLLDKVFNEKELIYQNACYDVTVLYLNNHILCKKIISDTMIAAHICWPEVPRNLGFLTSICLNVPMWKNLQFTLPAYYNCCDAANTYGIWLVLEKELEKLKLNDIFQAEMAQIEPAILLQLQGLYVNDLKRQFMEKEIKEKLVILENELETDIGRKVNFNSPKQIAQLLYVDMNLPMQYKRRKSANEIKKITTDEEAFGKLSRLTNNPILKKIITTKKLGHQLSSFVGFTISSESKVHTSYNITGINAFKIKKKGVFDEGQGQRSFGRWSSSSSIILPYGPGNLMNIPSSARIFYTAGEGKKMISADYMQAEAVVVAYLAHDRKLIKMFKDSFQVSEEKRKRMNWDAHKIKAASMFKIPVETVTKQQRHVGKLLRHARNYDAGPGVLANMLGTNMKEARDLIKLDKETAPHLELWHMRIQNELRQTKTLTNLLGRKHKFLDRWPRPGDTGDLFRSAYAYKPQSTIGDLLNQALTRLYKKYGDRMNIIINLLDAIYVIVDEDKVDETITLMKECMYYPLTYESEEFIVDIDFAVGDNWGELIKYETNT